MKQVYTYSEAKKLISSKGSIVCAVISGVPSVALIVQKSDFLCTIKRRGSARDCHGPVDYDGKASYFLWDESERTLYVDGGV